MANIFDYLDWRADVPFSVDPFHEVDNLVLAELAYTPLDGFVPADGTPISLAEVHTAFFRHHTREELLASKSYTAKAPLLMDGMLSGARFRDVRLCCYTNYVDENREVQLSCVTILLPDGTAYVAFRGTDGTLVGWKEDFNIACLPETEGQRYAVSYLNQMGARLSMPLRVGGHSKGGNLAVYSAACCDAKVQSRLLEIYTNDGPGFRHEFLDSEGYRAILPRIVSIVPDTSVIGMLLFTRSKHHVVKSSASGITQHDGFTWNVLRNHFEPAELTIASTVIDRSLGDWLEQMDDKSRKSLTDTVFSLFESTGQDTFSGISQQKWKSAEAIVSSALSMPRDRQQQILQQLQRLGQSGSQAVMDFLMGWLSK